MGDKQKIVCRIGIVAMLAIFVVSLLVKNVHVCMASLVGILYLNLKIYSLGSTEQNNDTQGNQQQPIISPTAKERWRGIRNIIKSICRAYRA